MKNSIEKYMSAALEEGRKALPKCLPNPPVGCVIVKDERIIARGYTDEPGKHHAEAMALSQLSEVTADMSIFVTLEPCSFQGRTPSCAKALVKTEICKIYVGMLDPDPRNSGKGIAILEAAGKEVQVGVLQEAVEKDLVPYLIKK